MMLELGILPVGSAFEVLVLFSLMLVTTEFGDW